ncbi:MAG: hypothetical protein WAZ94_04405 [Phycisphaerales bacterium]
MDLERAGWRCPGIMVTQWRRLSQRFGKPDTYLMYETKKIRPWVLVGEALAAADGGDLNLARTRLSDAGSNVAAAFRRPQNPADVLLDEEWIAENDYADNVFTLWLRLHGPDKALDVLRRSTVDEGTRLWRLSAIIEEQIALAQHDAAEDRIKELVDSMNALKGRVKQDSKTPVPEKPEYFEIRRKEEDKGSLVPATLACCRVFARIGDGEEAIAAINLLRDGTGRLPSGVFLKLLPVGLASLAADDRATAVQILKLWDSEGKSEYPLLRIELASASRDNAMVDALIDSTPPGSAERVQAILAAVEGLEAVEKTTQRPSP